MQSQLFIAGRVRPFAAGLLAWGLVCCLAGAAEGPAFAPAEPPHLATENEGNGPPSQVWLISSRQARGAGDLVELPLLYWKQSETGWEPADREEFLAADDPALPTCIYLHGNRIPHAQASRDGCRIYRSLRSSSAAAARPLRFVIWSWPSAEIQGNLQDIRVKACRSDEQAYCLAWLVDQISPEVQVSLVGYSYGARIATGALHLLGGGQLAGNMLGSRTYPQRLPLRAVLLAAALDNHWLHPRGRHGLALSQTDQMLITINSQDRALRWYRMVYGISSDAQALGSTGAAGLSAAERHKVTHLDVTRAVGSEHNWRLYLESPGIVARLAPYATFADERLQVAAHEDRSLPEWRLPAHQGDESTETSNP